MFSEPKGGGLRYIRLNAMFRICRKDDLLLFLLCYSCYTCYAAASGVSFLYV
jgi:hypothetical protein